MKRPIATLALALLLGGFVSLRGQNCSLSSNICDVADFGTLGLEASLGLNRHFSVSAGLKYNPFTYSDASGGSMQNRQRVFSLGTRFWPWHLWSGWWLSAKAQYQEFNRGGIESPLTSEGDRYGAGIGAGYSFMLSDHLNLDIGLGAWGGYAKLVSYECPTCGRIVSTSDRFFVLPNDLLLSISYIF